MAIAHDAATFGGSSTTSGSTTVSHEPVGTPAGALVTYVRVLNGTNDLTGITYGGEAMTLVDTAIDSAGEPGVVATYFLADPPAGIQDAVATHGTDAGTRNLYIVTCTASGSSEVVISGIAQESQADPQIALDSGASVALRYSFIWSGQADPLSLTPLADMTVLFTQDYGAASSRLDRQTTPGSGSFTIGYTALSDDVAMVAVAIKETIVNATATVAATLPSLTADVVAHVANFFAEVVATLPSLTGSAAATTFAAQGEATLPALTAAGVAATKNTGKGGNPPGKNKQPAANTGCTLPMLTVSIAAVTEPLSAVVDVTLPPLTAAAVASIPHEVDVVVTLPPLTAAGVASIPSTGGRPPQPGPGRITRSPSGSGRFVSTKTAMGRFRQPQQGQGR